MLAACCFAAPWWWARFPTRQWPTTGLDRRLCFDDWIAPLKSESRPTRGPWSPRPECEAAMAAWRPGVRSSTPSKNHHRVRCFRESSREEPPPQRGAWEFVNLVFSCPVDALVLIDGLFGRHKSAGWCVMKGKGVTWVGRWDQRTRRRTQQKSKASSSSLDPFLLTDLTPPHPTLHAHRPRTSTSSGADQLKPGRAGRQHGGATACACGPRPVWFGLVPRSHRESTLVKPIVRWLVLPCRPAGTAAAAARAVAVVAVVAAVGVAVAEDSPPLQPRSSCCRCST